MARFRDQAFLLVQAPAGQPCPRPGRPGEVISDAPVSVPNDHLVRRLIGDGSLVVVAAPTPKVAKPKIDTKAGGKL